MKRLPKIKQYTLILLISASYLSSAQTKLNINGAKMNMSNGVNLSTNDLSVSGNGSLNVASSTIKIAGSAASTGAIDVSNATVEMNGTAPQQLAGGSFSGNVVKALTINNTSGVTISNALNLTDVLTVANGSLASGGFLTLKSSDINTARIAPVTSLAAMPISGDVIVERFISAKRAFRFLTAPVNTSGTIRDNWMEGVNNATTSVNNNPVPNYGTHITGSEGNTNGFDQTYTNNASLFTFNNASQAWVAATSTGGQLTAGSAYSIMVRGSRSTNLNSNTPTPSPTTLRAKGAVVTGTIVLGAGGTPGMPALSAVANAYSFIANPYASPVDWALIETNNISPTIYIFDPTINGSNGRGGYVAFNRSIGDAGGNNNASSNVDNNIQSGQAFFVQTTGTIPNPSLTFRENHKSGINRPVFRNPSVMPKLSLQLLLPGQESTGSSADGLAAYFSNDFDSSIGDEDSYKFTNQDENIAIVRNKKTLSIEGRKPVTTSDTLPLKVWKLTLKEYALKIYMKNFEDNVEGYLEDRFLHTSTKLNSEASTIVPFTITTDTLSAAPERFRIVFRNAVTLPVLISGIKAYEKNKGVEVEWKTESENNTDRYVVEKSSNAQQFDAAGSIKAKGNTGIGASASYQWFDEKPFNGDNYYRIKTVEKSGDKRYSKTVKVYMGDKDGVITVLIGQVKSNAIEMIFKNVRKGNYTLTLVNNSGQKIYSGRILHTGGSDKKVIQLRNLLSAGIYNLQVLGADKSKIIPVLIQ